MNKQTKEVFLNCKEQGFEDYLIQAYYLINIGKFANPELNDSIK